MTVAPVGPLAMAQPLLAHRCDGDVYARTPLLLLNGGFMSMSAWEPIAGPLAERLPLVRCDFRGQLLSPGPAHRELGPDVDDVVAVLDHLGLARVHVLGTSFGGLVGLLLAARRPERVASLTAVTVADHAGDVVLAGTRDLRPVVAAILAGAEPGTFHDALVESAYSASYVAANRELLATRRRQIGFLPRSWFAAVDDLLTAVASFDLRPELGRIRCPTLVVVAADDRVLPPAGGRAVAAAIAGARLVEHPTSGHVLVAEQPAWLVEQTLAFVEELPS